MSHLLIERQDKVLTVTLDRPEIGNAFNGVMIAELSALFAGLGSEAGVHVVVLAGAGKHFCAGADLAWMKQTASFGRVDNAEDARRLAGLFEAIDACPKPVVGRIHGAARGGGVGVVAALDIPVASESASFALTEVRLGLAPAVISPYVVRKIGTPRARELFLTGEAFDARAALGYGLVNHVVADAELDQKVAERVKLLLLGGPKALAACKDLARTITRLTDDDAMVKTANLIAELRAGDEAQEGMRAFLQKRHARLDPVMARAITKVLIANRGEIVVRIAATLRAMGIGSVAVYSDADREALHVRACDEALPIGPAPARESYLRGDVLLEAARLSGADALHPGYGFLSENADFAESVAAAGLTWIGPPAAAMRQMGSKIAARQTMEAAGVPVVPGVHDAGQGLDDLARAAARIGFPVLVKAAAGGGGKGMRSVWSAAELREALEAAQREAAASFGDGSVYLEKLLVRPRHVEIQIFGDSHGQVIHLGERECSIQRRHQKVIEESPSPALTPELRAAMGEAAVNAGRAVGYVGAGTVELMLDDGGGFYFLEMNTRLQVEHPITEGVTGLDLVRLQLRVAEGHALPPAPELRGHAIEARLYAEDPSRGFLPQVGRLLRYRLPPMPGIRLDTGFSEGDEVSVHYDPMLAKLIAWGEDREHARRRLWAALTRWEVHGVVTNLGFLRDLVAHPDFIAGRTHTGFIAEHWPDGVAQAVPDDDALIALAVAEALGLGNDGPGASPEKQSRESAVAVWQRVGPWRGVGGT